ncbi:MAG TPA: hypothetical protein VKH19_19050 [Gemmatimonadaceae bacterium]|nr:hypothetical protein [Gemmatimonadaceae bacterium]
MTSACSSAAPSPRVQWAFTAPLCSGVNLPVQLHVDGALVAIDTFNTFGSPPHDTISAIFTVQEGTRHLSARVVNGFQWPEKVVSLAAGETYLDTLNFYCS